jgi:hypothetical protein
MAEPETLAKHKELTGEQKDRVIKVTITIEGVKKLLRRIFG